MGGPARGVGGIGRAVGHAVEAVTWLLTGVLVLLVSANVFARYALEMGWLWAEEVSRLIFVWAVFLGAYVALRHGQHMAIEVVMARVPASARTGVLALTRLCVLVFLAVVTWSGASLAWTTLELGR